MHARGLLDLYLNLFEASQRSQRADHRSHFLTLAAFHAWQGGHHALAGELCDRMREIEPSHPHAAEMPLPERFQAASALARDLGETYPFEKAEHLLDRYRAGGYQGQHPFVIPDAESVPVVRASAILESIPKRPSRSKRSKRRSRRSSQTLARRERYPEIDPPKSTHGDPMPTGAPSFHWWLALVVGIVMVAVYFGNAITGGRLS